MVCIVKQFYTLKEIYMPMICFHFPRPKSLNMKGNCKALQGLANLKLHCQVQNKAYVTP